MQGECYVVSETRRNLYGVSQTASIAGIVPAGVWSRYYSLEYWQKKNTGVNIVAGQGAKEPNWVSSCTFSNANYKHCVFIY